MLASTQISSVFSEQPLSNVFSPELREILKGNAQNYQDTHT